MLILYMLDELEELNFSRYEICDLGSDMFKLDMIASTIKISSLQGPARGTVLCFVFVLSCRDHNLKAIGLFFAKIEADFISCLLESFADNFS